MSMWKDVVRGAQRGRCLICDEPVRDSTNGSWDHFVPQVYSQKGHQTLRVGLAWWTHQRCNTSRGHALPTIEMIARASAIIAGLPDPLRRLACENLDRALAVHRQYVALLLDARARVEALTPAPILGPATSAMLRAVLEDPS